MRRMQIGMWHQFDPDRFNEYGSNLIKGIEASRLNSMTDYQCLQGFCKKKSLQFGIHPPGVRNEHEHGMPKLTSIDFEARNEALRLAEAEVALAAEVKADYVLLHYPFPPIFPVKRNLRYFDLLPSLEYIESRDVSKRDLMGT